MKKILFGIISIFVFAMIITTKSNAIEKGRDIFVSVGGMTVGSNVMHDFDSVYIDDNNRIMVPFRNCMERLGAKVEWDSKNKIAKTTYNNITVEIPIGMKYILIDGVKKEMDTVAAIKYARVFLPVRAVFEAFGYNVEWSRERYLDFYDSEEKEIKKETDYCHVILSMPAKELETCDHIDDSDKIDDAKNVIYRVQMNTHGKLWRGYTTDYAQLPYVNINIPEVKVFNDIMLKKNKFFEMDFNKRYDECQTKGYTKFMGIVQNNYSKYTFAIRDNILSVYQTDRRPAGEIITNAFNVINIDLVNKKVLTYFDMLDRFNLTLDDVKKAIFDECNVNDGYVRKEEIPMYVSEYLENIYMKDRLFYEDYNPAVSLKDYDPTVHSGSCWRTAPTKSYIYLNEEGNVCTNVAGINKVVLEGVILKE